MSEDGPVSFDDEEEARMERALEVAGYDVDPETQRTSVIERE